MTHTPGTWYNATKKDSLQGLVYTEETGTNIAVTYDPNDAALVSAAPDLYEALMEMLNTFHLDIYRMAAAQFGLAGEAELAVRKSWNAITKAKGE